MRLAALSRDQEKPDVVKIEFQYTGQLHCQAIHSPSATQLETDAPTDNQGLGQAFSPTDLVATALGTCMLTTVGIKARDKRWSLDGLVGSVEKHMSVDLPRRIARLSVRIHWPAQLDASACELLERVALSCPVAKSLHPGIELETQFNRANGTGP